MSNRTCSTADCTKPHYGRGWCKFHYQRAYKSGALEAQPRTLSRPTDSIAARLRNIGWTVMDSGCWEWNGSKNKAGYGQMAIGADRPHIVSRIAYQEWVKIPEPGADICHKCDNPPCMNPAHLFEGTRFENITDMVAKKRHAHGERQKHKITDEQVAEIRATYAAGGITQRELSTRYEISQAQISNIIRFTRRAKKTSWAA